MDKRLMPARPDLAALSLKGKVEAERFVDGVLHQVSTSASPLRRTPTPQGAQETELLFGEGFEVFEDKDGWSWGQFRTDQYVGYVRSADLSRDIVQPTHRVTALRTYVYEKPDLKSFPKHLLSMGAQLCVTGSQDKFSETEIGFVFTNHLSLLGACIQDYVSVAEQFLGAPYYWGGRQSLGLDCSSLLQLSIQQIGLAVPRDTDLQQQALGDALPADEPRKRGDIVFWKGHVGVMVDEQKFVHANATNMSVTIDELDGFANQILQSDGPILSIKRLK